MVHRVILLLRSWRVPPRQTPAPRRNRRSGPCLDLPDRRFSFAAVTSGRSPLTLKGRAAKREASGRVAEWLKAPVLKTGRRATVSWVRIPPLPPFSDFALSPYGRRSSRDLASAHPAFRIANPSGSNVLPKAPPFLSTEHADFRQSPRAGGHQHSSCLIILDSLQYLPTVMARTRFPHRWIQARCRPRRPCPARAPRDVAANVAP
jgi:hypothetical protein